jgi:putative nucleotidyltransferase with HDIG domain
VVIDLSCQADHVPDWTFPLCPTEPDWHLDWNAILEANSWLEKLRDCPQNPVYHAEGDVLTHTRMVTQALVANHAWRALAPETRSILFASALLHDIGKPEKTVIEDDGRITSRGHASAGARIAQRLLWLESEAHVPFHCRQMIVALVWHHGLPLFFLEREDPRRAVIEASHRVRLDLVALLAEADVMGRICPDQDELLGRVDLFRAFCAEHDCLETPYLFASDHSRFLYCRTPGRDPTYHAFDDTRLEVVMLSGLPGSGKDTFARHHLPGWPSIHLDAIRRELSVSWTDNQGQVFQLARDRARALLRQHTPFVWNATNINRSVRDPLISLFHDYGARVRIVYIEPRLEMILDQNRNRDAVVKEAVILGMISRLEVPDVTEAHAVEYLIR